MDKSPNTGRCRHTQGLLLLEKKCPEPGIVECCKCGAVICEKHSRDVDDIRYCLRCYKSINDKQDQQELNEGYSTSMFYFDPGLGIYRRDPYYYAEQNYDGWGRYEKGYFGAQFSEELNAQAALEAQSSKNDVHDFTDGDSEVFDDVGEGQEVFEDSEEFENDLDAS